MMRQTSRRWLQLHDQAGLLSKEATAGDGCRQRHIPVFESREQCAEPVRVQTATSVEGEDTSQLLSMKLNIMGS